MNYLFGFILIFLEKITISLANILDSKLSRKTFSSVWTIIVLNGILAIPIIPLLVIILHPQTILISQVLIILVVSFIEVFYQFPYYKALQENDTSVIISLFGLGRIFTPLFAYFLINEILSPVQYLGFFIIVISSVFVSFDRKTFKFSKAFYYMIPVAIIVAFQGVISKAGLEMMDWKTFYFWSFVYTIPFYLTPLLIKKCRIEVTEFIKNPFRKKFIPLYIQDVLSWVSQGFGTLALSLLPITIIKAFGSFQSLSVHLISIILPKKFDIDNEKFSWRKIIIFLFMGIGMILTLNLI